MCPLQELFCLAVCPKRHSAPAYASKRSEPGACVLICHLSTCSSRSPDVGTATLSPHWLTCLPTHLPLSAAEAVVRGHKSGLLTTADYNNLCQCENLDDVKLHLVSFLSYFTPEASSMSILTTMQQSVNDAVCICQCLWLYVTRDCLACRQAQTTVLTWQMRRRLCTPPPSWSAARRSLWTTGTRCGPM